LSEHDVELVEHGLLAVNLFVAFNPVDEPVAPVFVLMQALAFEDSVKCLLSVRLNDVLFVFHEVNHSFQKPKVVEPLAQRFGLCK